MIQWVLRSFTKVYPGRSRQGGLRKNRFSGGVPASTWK